MGSFSFFSLLMLTVVMSVHGQISIVATCRADGANALVSLEVTNGDTKHVQILGCTSQVGPLSGSPDTADMALCPLTWGAPYEVYVKASAGVILKTDHHEQLTCTRSTDDITVSEGLTVITSEPTASLSDPVDPVGGMMISDDTQDWDGTPTTVAIIGTPLRLHLFLTAPFQDSFGILAIDIWVMSAVGTILLTSGGCQNQAWFSDVIRIDDAILRVDFDAFMQSPGTATFEDMDWHALLQVCAGPCPAADIDCSAGPFGPPEQEGRRRRRAVSNDTMIEEIEVTGKIRVSPFQVDSETDIDVNVNEGQTGKIEECEVCMQKSVMYGVTTVLVLALILSLAVSCFLFVRARRSRKILREDSEMTGSANPAYRR